jgi:hypothetical protein
MEFRNVRSYEAVVEFSDGNEEGLFIINRTANNKGMVTVAKRIDREAGSEHLLTVKCFKKSARPHSLRKQYNRQVPALVCEMCH